MIIRRFHEDSPRLAGTNRAIREGPPLEAVTMRKIFLPVLLGLLLASPFPSRADTDFFQVLSYTLTDEPNHNFKFENDQFEIISIRVTPLEDLGKYEKEVKIEIQSKIDQKIYQIKYQNAFQDLFRAEMVDQNLLLVFGNLPRDGGCITICDIQKEKWIETLRCHKYDFSPSRNYLIYETWYPRLAPPDARKSILMLYDFKRCEENKPIINTLSDFPPLAIGWPIFPEEPAALQSSDISLFSEYSILSPFLWSTGEREFIVVIYDETVSENFIVRIDLNDGIDHPRIKRKPIDVDSLIHWDRMRDSTRNEFMKRPFRFFVQEMKWIDSDHIEAIPVVEENCLKEKYEFEVPRIE